MSFNLYYNIYGIRPILQEMKAHWIETILPQTTWLAQSKTRIQTQV